MYTAPLVPHLGRPKGYYRSELNHFSQTRRIESITYSLEEKYNATTRRMGYESTVSLKHLSSGQVITVTSSMTTSKKNAREQAAKAACSQIQDIEHQMGPPKMTSHGKVLN